MHEATIATNILSIAESRSAALPGSSVLRVYVRIGDFRNIDSGSLKFAFDALKADYPRCSKSELVVEQVAAVGRCMRQHQYCPSLLNAYSCSCGAGLNCLMQGEELEIFKCTFETATREANFETV